MAAEDDIDIVVFDVFFEGKSDGVIVEVGAACPDFLSISARYRSAGWKVIAIEPNPAFCEKHRSKGYEVLEYAVSDRDENNVDFFVITSKGTDYLGGKVTSESFSSLGMPDEFKELYGRVESLKKTNKISVTMRKLDTILATHEPELEKVDLLAVDVEGWELSVLKGFSLGRYQPTAVILENLFDKDDCALHMAANGYTKWLRLGYNEIFVRNECLDFWVRAAATRYGAIYKVGRFRNRVANRLKRMLGVAK